MTNPKLKVKIVGDEVFGLQKRERIRKFDDATIFALAVMMGDLRAEQERHSSIDSKSFCIGCILPPEDVKRYVLLKDGVRYLVILVETRKNKEIPRGCFVVSSQGKCSFEISEFYIQEGYRRKGFGKMMFNAFLRRFKKDLGCSSAQLSLSVALNNTAAEEFYLHLGFAEVAKVMEMKIKKRR